MQEFGISYGGHQSVHMMIIELLLHRPSRDKGGFCGRLGFALLFGMYEERGMVVCFVVGKGIIVMFGL